MSLKEADLPQVLERHGDEWLDYCKSCSRCGRLYVMWAAGASCPDCREGTLRKLGRYVP